MIIWDYLPVFFSIIKSNFLKKKRINGHKSLKFQINLIKKLQIFK